jgi:hypothetical protein
MISGERVGDREREQIQHQHRQQLMPMLSVDTQQHEETQARKNHLSENETAINSKQHNTTKHIKYLSYYYHQCFINTINNNCYIDVVLLLLLLF